MGDVVNLRLARKDRARKASEAWAANNRAVFGRTKTEKKATDEDRSRNERHLDGHARNKPNEDGG